MAIVFIYFFFMFSPLFVAKFILNWEKYNNHSHSSTKNNANTIYDEYAKGRYARCYFMSNFRRRSTSHISLGTQQQSITWNWVIKFDDYLIINIDVFFLDCCVLGAGVHFKKQPTRKTKCHKFDF